MKPNPGRYDAVAEDLDKLELPAGTSDLERVFENQATISKTGEAGSELTEAVAMWAKGGNIKMREGAAEWATGIPNFRGGIFGRQMDSGAKIAEAASNAPQMPFPVHRGIKLTEQKHRQTLTKGGGRDSTWELANDDIQNMFKPGQHFDQHISSFSTDADLARKFAAAGPEEGTGVVFELEAGARGLNIEGISSYIGEQERIVSGTYEVLGVRVEKVPWGPTFRDEIHVDIRQVKTIVKEAK